MIEIIPAILPKDYEDLKNKISLVKGVCDLVQIDICDGIYVKSLTWPFLAREMEANVNEAELDYNFRKILNEEEGLPFWEEVDFELDLMVEDAVENFDIYTKLGPKRIIFHIGAIGVLEDFQHFLEGMDPYVRDTMKIGVAISPSKSVEQIFPLINYIDFVQVMGIDHEGAQGEEFDPKCIEHIKNLRQKFPDLVISVDGGVDLETAPALIRAGASRLTIGSAIWSTDDVIGTIESFRNL